ncbi:LysR family transcriptional regulator [Rouxiella silvae]|uniref:LysR family transcriptional regulator n=1 Tax=Rouxiella silvae TaxID=1646373 RepID=A0AA40X463_9GAMM|nr:LysR family transcriptional regulator [Rouxiella silvae]MBF6638362.1 LysR family transcriptional regulator [Rouxiella silvae]ORJ21898.1 LysR family transcriptional regulator [Rouxiella silvae]
MIDSEITFRKLEVFLVFMEKLNIARTAEQLGLSSVSVHRALHSLEEGLRCPLFIHRGRNLLPLPAADTLQQHAIQVIEQMALGIQAAQRTAGFGEKRIRLGTLYSLTLETIPRLIMGLKIRRPSLELELIMGSNETLLSRLAAQQLDAILISTSDSFIDEQLYENLPLFKDDIYLAVPADSALVTEGTVDLRDFRQQKFVSLAEGFATYHGFQEAFQIAGFEPDIVTQVNDIFSMLSLVQAGVGCTLIPGRMKGVYADTVKLLPLAEPYQMRQTIALVFARSRERDPNLLALAAESRMYARSHPQKNG